MEEADEMVLKQRKVPEAVAQITETREVAEETEEGKLEEEDQAKEVRENLLEANPEEEGVQTVFWRLVLMLVLEPVPRSLVLVWPDVQKDVLDKCKIISINIF